MADAADHSRRVATMPPDTWHQVLDYFRAWLVRPTWVACTVLISAGWAFLVGHASDVFLVAMVAGFGAGVMDTLLGIVAAWLVPERAFDRHKFALVVRKGIGYTSLVVLLMAVGMVTDVAASADAGPRWFYILPGAGGLGLFGIEGLSCLDHCKALSPVIGRLAVSRWLKARLGQFVEAEPEEQP